MKRWLLTALVAAPVVLPVGTAAYAQRFDESVMRSCNEQVGQMKFEGWPADRNREMMMSACQNNGGTIPGAGATHESNVSLPNHGAPTPRR
jgi:hypothetical protein